MRKFLPCFFIIIFITLFPAKAWADDPQSIVSGGLTSVESTNIQLESLKADIDYSQIEEESHKSFETIHYLFVNPYNSSQEVEMKFPTCRTYYKTKSGYECLGGRYSDLKILVDGIQVKNLNITKKPITGSEKETCSNNLKRISGDYYVFKHSFLPKQRTEISINYNWHIAGVSINSNYFSDNYMLSSSGLWSGPITSGEVAFTFPYASSDEYVLLNSGDLRFNNYNTFSKRITKAVKDNKILVTFSNIQPQASEDLQLYFIYSKVRQKMEDLKKNALNSGSSSAYLALAKESQRLWSNTLMDQKYLDYFETAIDGAAKFSELEEITNFLMNTKNGGDQQEAAVLRGLNCSGDSCSEIKIYKKLANKRLALLPGDDYGKALNRQMLALSSESQVTIPVQVSPTIPLCFFPGEITRLNKAGERPLQDGNAGTKDSPKTLTGIFGEIMKLLNFGVILFLTGYFILGFLRGKPKQNRIVLNSPQKLNKTPNEVLKIKSFPLPVIPPATQTLAKNISNEGVNNTQSVTHSSSNTVPLTNETPLKDITPEDKKV